MSTYVVPVRIPESEGLVYVEADSVEDALAAVGDYPTVSITYVNGIVEPTSDPWVAGSLA